MERLKACGIALWELCIIAWQWAWPKLKCLWDDHRLGRMAQWGAFSAVLYGLVLCKVWPLVVQAALTKGANVNAGAFLGYWIDRTLFRNLDIKFDADPNAVPEGARAARVLSRGVIVGACIIGLSLGVGA